MDAQHYKAAVAGRRSRFAGNCWEKMIEESCKHYRLYGLAEIDKTPEPMKPLGRPNPKGQFMACYTKQAQPDYKGALKGGRAIVFEAKHTDGDRLQQSVVSEEQERQLDRYAALGAECFVMVSFGFQQFFKIPWETFRNMKETYGRKYITPEDVQEYRIRYIGGVLRFLKED